MGSSRQGVAQQQRSQPSAHTQTHTLDSHMYLQQSWTLRPPNGINGFTCSDGYRACCSPNQECYATKPFPKGDWAAGCRTGPHCSKPPCVNCGSYECNFGQTCCNGGCMPASASCCGISTCYCPNSETCCYTNGHMIPYPGDKVTGCVANDGYCPPPGGPTCPPSHTGTMRGAISTFLWAVKEN